MYIFCIVAGALSTVLAVLFSNACASSLDDRTPRFVTPRLQVQLYVESQYGMLGQRTITTGWQLVDMKHL